MNGSSADYILVHAEHDEADILTWVKSDSPRLEYFVDDGPYVLLDGHKVLEVYQIEGPGVWRESLDLMNDLMSSLRLRQEKWAAS